MRARLDKFTQLEQDRFDLLVIGGGATGLGIAVDASTRGYKTALVEQGDFAQATSSRATKLVHGGVRYLVSGQIHLVYEALRERKVMMENAPHLVQALPFLTPAYSWFDLPYYGAGLKAYQVLSGSSSLGPTQILSARETRDRIPGIAPAGLKGSILYHDGQFDDARMALALARTAEDNGCVVLNYARCAELRKENGRVCGALVEDVEGGGCVAVQATTVINATGIFVDGMRQKDDPGVAKLLSVSRGTHLVVAGDVLGQANAIMVPKTKDGRIIFAIPWLGKVVIGTTDVPTKSVALEPGHEVSEIQFLLETINPYLARHITEADILSVFSGLRPLVTGRQASTAKLSREHTIEFSPTGLVTIAGGKWTTYRRMAEDTIDAVIDRQMLPSRRCVSRKVRLHGAPPGCVNHAETLARYGTDAIAIESLHQEDAALALRLDEALPFTGAEVIYAVREEMARHVEDVLSRRTRALLLDSKAALRGAPKVASLMAKELGYGHEWVERELLNFDKLARTFYQAGFPKITDEPEAAGTSDG
jgi:glycerol-3-phosphate dehydrogenase